MAWNAKGNTKLKDLYDRPLLRMVENQGCWRHGFSARRWRQGEALTPRRRQHRKGLGCRRRRSHQRWDDARVTGHNMFFQNKNMFVFRFLECWRRRCPGVALGLCQNCPQNRHNAKTTPALRCSSIFWRHNAYWTFKFLVLRRQICRRQHLCRKWKEVTPHVWLELMLGAWSFSKFQALSLG